MRTLLVRVTIPRRCFRPWGYCPCSPGPHFWPKALKWKHVDRCLYHPAEGSLRGGCVGLGAACADTWCVWSLNKPGWDSGVSPEDIREHWGVAHRTLIEGHVCFLGVGPV